MQKTKVTPTKPIRRIYTGDNLTVMRTLDSETVDLVYLDPPFKSDRKYSSPIGSKSKYKGQVASFNDTWKWDDADDNWIYEIEAKHPDLASLILAASKTYKDKPFSKDHMGAYLTFMTMRLLEIYRLLKPTGSMYLHIDPTASHYLKTVCDYIFGRKNFRNEIVWAYTGPSNTKRWFPRKHDVILFYAKSDKAQFNREQVRVPYKLLVGTPGGKIIGKHHNKKRVEELRAKGKVVEDWWSDIPPIVNQAEKTGYPTQKPLKLLDRIIKASSNPGDIVLDPFAGCATACVQAEILGRQWIGIDIEDFARKLIVERLESGFMQGSLESDFNPREDIEMLSIGGRVKAQSYKDRRPELYRHQDGVCNGCKTHLPFVEQFAVDHIVPRSKGGTDDIENLQLLCSMCNSIKGDRDMNYLRFRLAEMATE